MEGRSTGRHPTHPKKRLIRVAILGSSPIGSLLAASLSEHPEVSQVVAAGTDRLREALSQSDVALGCWPVGSGQDQSAAQSAMAAGVPYISGSDSPEDFSALWELREQASRSGSLIVAGMSWSPGITNLMAAAGAASLEQTSAVRVAWSGSPSGAGAREVLRKASNALNGVAMAFESNSWVLEEAGGRPERVYFPEPLGWRQVHLCAAAETLSLPSTIPGVGQVVVKGGLTEPLLDQVVRGASSLGRYLSIRRLGSWSGSAARMLPPTGGAAAGQPWSGIRVDVTGTRGDLQETVTYGLIDQLPNLTVAPLVVAAVMVGRSGEMPAGVLAPESAFDAREFFLRLSERGVRVATLQREPSRTSTMVPPGP